MADDRHLENSYITKYNPILVKFCML